MYIVHLGNLNVQYTAFLLWCIYLYFNLGFLFHTLQIIDKLYTFTDIPDSGAIVHLCYAVFVVNSLFIFLNSTISCTFIPARKTIDLKQTTCVNAHNSHNGAVSGNVSLSTATTPTPTRL